MHRRIGKQPESVHPGDRRTGQCAAHADCPHDVVWSIHCRVPACAHTKEPAIADGPHDRLATVTGAEESADGCGSAVRLCERLR